MVMELETLRVEGPDAFGVAAEVLNRPSYYNALNTAMFRELPVAIASLDSNPCVRVIVLKASGKHFCAGIDLSNFAETLSELAGEEKEQQEGAEDGARMREKLLRTIHHMQDAFTAFEKCRKPVIAAVHGTCIGGGIDMITACDLRYCCADARFSVKEVDIAIVADLGTLQRLPRLVGFGNAVELSFTGRDFTGDEAKTLGLVQEAFPSREAMEQRVEIVARGIAGKSPLAVMGIKKVLLASQSLSVSQGLEFVATWNAALVMSSDLKEAMVARLQKRTPVFAKL